MLKGKYSDNIKKQIFDFIPILWYNDYVERKCFNKAVYKERRKSEVLLYKYIKTILRRMNIMTVASEINDLFKSPVSLYRNM